MFPPGVLTHPNKESHCLQASIIANLSPTALAITTLIYFGCQPETMTQTSMPVICPCASFPGNSQSQCLRHLAWPPSSTCRALALTWILTFSFSGFAGTIGVDILYR